MSEANNLKTYSTEIANLINKLDITDVLTRDQMIGQGFEEVTAYSYKVGRLTMAMDHASLCTNNRCCRGFCFSIKRILKHYGECYHLDCMECHRFNMVVFEHSVFCGDSRTCKIPGCLSIARANGRISDTAVEPCTSTQ
ncbi:TAZ-type domain-containing protein [Caenorhabditis elegans]|uniref:TAZ-type domain-containing protein n=1 Tax=Caenorhabditis elegans TaxID=6239 RepID=Q7YWN9_CAEEL|nr:TAZ-type domain-containing protein [Caenorhabditis elegans]CAE18019.2 TAZ-type domain-containing protein [Caenorhabditis elegans]